MKMRTSIDFPTLPYDHVTNSFLLEICFCGPNYPTFLYNVTLFSLFFLKAFLRNFLDKIGLLKVSYKPESHPTTKKISKNRHICPFFTKSWMKMLKFTIILALNIQLHTILITE